MYCPNCGAKNSCDSLFCVSCGEKFTTGTKKQGKHKKRCLKFIFIFLGVLFLILLGSFLGWKWYQSSRLTGDSWGDVYYNFIKESRESSTDKTNISDGSMIEFIQVSDLSDPVMIVQYEESDDKYTNIYYINDDKVENVISMLSSDVALLYHIKQDEYQWYVHKEVESKDQYIAVDDIISSDTKEDSDGYLFDNSDDFEEEFVLVDVDVFEIQYSTDWSNSELKDAVADAVDEYQDLDDMITDDVKKKVDSVKENSEEEEMNDDPSAFQVGCYTLHYGSYCGTDYQYTADWNSEMEVCIVLNSDGTYTKEDRVISSNEVFTSSGNYMIEDGSKYGDYYAKYQILTLGDVMYIVSSDDTLESMAGSSAKFVYQDK